MEPHDIERLTVALEEKQLVPDVPLVMGDASEVSILQRHYEEAEEGRTRNGRIALILALVVAILVASNAVALAGWFSTSRALEQRNRAVRDLGQNFATQAAVAQRQAQVDICQDQALAQWFDDALLSRELEQGVLTRYYSTCERTDGKRFRA